MAAIFFANILGTCKFHHGENIVEAVIRAIEMDIPGIAEYINARFLKEDGIINPVQPPLKNETILFTPDGEFAYSKTTTPIIIDEDKVVKNLFETSKQRKRIDSYIFDIPRMHKWN